MVVVYGVYIRFALPGSFWFFYRELLVVADDVFPGFYFSELAEFRFSDLSLDSII